MGNNLLLFTLQFSTRGAQPSTGGDSCVRRKLGTRATVQSRGDSGISATVRSFECLNSYGAVILGTDGGCWCWVNGIEGIRSGTY